VKVIGIDTARRRISLSLKQLSAPPANLVNGRSEQRAPEYDEVEEEV
jgi:ribosomal protein S1